MVILIHFFLFYYYYFSIRIRTTAECLADRLFTSRFLISLLYTSPSHNYSTSKSKHKHIVDSIRSSISFRIPFPAYITYEYPRVYIYVHIGTCGEMGNHKLMSILSDCQYQHRMWVRTMTNGISSSTFNHFNNKKARFIDYFHQSRKRKSSFYILLAIQ